MDPLVIDGVSLDVARGDVVGILGPNGSGKTTLLKLLSRALRPQSGRISFDRHPLDSFPAHKLAQRIAVVPQETELAFDYTVLEVVLMGRYPYLGAFEIEGPSDLAAAYGALGVTGTRAFADRPFRTLSGGEKQRVVIASALAQVDQAATRRAASERSDASLLLLDEPTASLDLKYQLEIAALLRRFNGEHGITMMVSTHDLHFARAVCTRMVLLSRGQVLAQGSPDEMLVAPLLAELYDIDAGVVRTMVTT